MPNGFEVAARNADFVFRGTIQELGASTLAAAIQPTGATAIVLVEQVFHAPAAFAGLGESTVTVRLREAGHLAVGDVADFAANGWLAGESLAVVELDHRSADRGFEVLSNEVVSMKQGRSEQELQDRIGAAAVVVVGRVSAVRPLTGPRLAAAETEERRSEHEPQLMEAVVDVTESIKGSMSGDSVVVVFPSSEDVAYVYTPKFEMGQEGVFILHAPEAFPRLAAAAVGAFTAPTMLDVQPVAESAVVRALAEGRPHD